MRVLEDAEAAAFREALISLWDEITLCDEIKEEHEVGVGRFDELQANQKLVMLVDVGEALLYEHVASPQLTALNEGTIAAVYRQLQFCVEFEIDDGGTGTHFRSLTHHACQQAGTEDIPVIFCTDIDEWTFLIEGLQDRILWDSDFESVEMLDTTPEERATMGRIMGVSEDYYTAIARDPRGDESADLKERLQALVRGTSA